DLAANVTDDAAKPRAQKLQFPPRAFELVGMRVAPHHDGGALGQAQIALAQLNALALGQLHQLLDRAMGEPGVGRMRDRLLLYSGISRNPFESFGVGRPGGGGHREALLQQRDDLLLTQPLAPARERRAIKWQLVPEHHLPTEVLEIRVLHPSLAQLLLVLLVLLGHRWACWASRHSWRCWSGRPRRRGRFSRLGHSTWGRLGAKQSWHKNRRTARRGCRRWSRSSTSSGRCRAATRSSAAT